MTGSEDKKPFVLEEYNNVSVFTKDLPKDTVQDLTKDELTEWSPFKTWITTLTASLALQNHASHPDHKDPYKLHDITIDSYTRFANKRIGFLKLTANVSKANTPQVTLPGTIFLRGPSVAMLVVLIPAADRSDADHDDDDDNNAHVLLTVQPRIATGSLAFVELPAGMMDADSNFAGKAAQEIKEELGLVIKEDELICLTDKVAEIRKSRRAKEKNTSTTTASTGAAATPAEERLPFAMYPSAGGCDEYIKIFAHEKRVSREQLREWQGKLTGLRDQGEMITLKVVPLEDLWLEGGMDSKALAALTMYTQLKQWEKKTQQQHGRLS
ncbi:hypothetical protein N0V82_008197 [Gnomoniopsis sp. IMI 355080]|nr:hypothetical protein N0V82_008197 [Gnomoniopsis sp. IMI 355080]